LPGKALIASMPNLSVEETAATQSTNDSEVGPGEEAIVVEGASVDAEGTSILEGISVVAEETSLVAATSVRVAIVLLFIVGHCLIEPLTSLIPHPTRPQFDEKSRFAISCSDVVELILVCRRKEDFLPLARALESELSPLHCFSRS
jgi:hypothetical protein